MRVLTISSSSHKDASSSDSDDEIQEIPVNRNYRCLPRKAPQTTTDADFFVVDTVGGVDVEAEHDKREEEGRKKRKRQTLAQRVAATNRQTKQVPLSKEVAKLLSKAVVQPGYESALGSAPAPLGPWAAKRARRAEREKTAGGTWFDLPATELTDERRADLELLTMRSALDPLRHYRKNDRAVLPKYFQVGRVVDDPRDFFSGRLTKKERKKTILEEVMADEKIVDKGKRRYKELQAAEKTKRRGAFQKGGFKKKRKESTKKK